MTAGKRDQLVTIQSYRLTDDGGGGQLEAWADLAETPTVWAAVNVRRGSEQVDDGRRNARQTATFEMLNRNDLSELNRIMWNGEAWAIRNVQRSSGRRPTIIIEAERGAP